MIVLSNISLALSDTSFDALNDPNQINFAYTLLDLHYAYDINFDTLGVETTASAWADIAVDFYANLTLPQTGFDAEITLGNGGFADQVIEVGDQVVFATRDYVFSGVTSSSFLDLSTLAFSTGFDVDVDAGISDITFDIPFGSDIVIDGLSIGTDGVQRFELLGFALDANAGEHFTSDVDPFEEALNDIPVESIMAGTYAVSQFPLDINWDFAALGFDETSQTLVPSIAGSSDFSVQNGSGDAFLEAVLDLDDLVAQYLLPGLSNPSNPLLSPFEFNWSSTIFEDTIWEVNPQLLATLLDLDLSIGVELVQQTSFDQTGTSVSVSQNGVDLATGSLGDTLSFDGLQSEGTGVYDVTYGASGDLTTSYGIIFTMDVPVTLMDVAFWNGDLEFDVDGHGFTTPQVPDDAWNFTVYDNTFRIGQSGFIPIPGMDSVTAVEFVSGIEQFEVEFTEDAWRAVSSSDPDVVVQNPADGSGASCDIIGTNGNDSLVGDDCDNLIDALAGRDTLIGGAGDDLLLVSYNSNAGDDPDSVDGGAGTDRAVYTLGGYATLYLVRFYDSEGNRFADTDDFDTIFDLSRDLANFSQIGLHGGSTSTFTNVEAIDIDATGGTRSNSAGEFWYLGGTTYLGSTRGYNDRFIANWSDQTNAVEWDFGSTAVQTLSNGITVGYMDRMHVLFGSGNDDITGRSGADHIAGGGGNDTLDGGQGQDTLIGGAGDDLLLVSYNNDAGDGWDSVDGGAGTDRAVYTLGGYATLYLVRFYDSEGNRFADTDDFDTIFDLSRDLANFSQIGLHGGSTSTFTNVEAIDIDATGGTRSNSAGEFWYLGGTTYLGSTRGYNDRFIANWSDQTNAVEWDVRTAGAQDLANGVTVGYFERVYLALGGGDDTVTGAGNADHIEGGGGDDLLDGSGGNDTLIGGADDDFLNGGEGSDLLVGGVGDDILGGGFGNDTYQITVGDGADLILDPDGGSVNLDGFDFDAAEFSRDGSVLQIDFTGSTDSLRILNYFSQSGDWRFYFDGVARDLDVADLFHPWDSLGRIVTRVDGDNSTSWHLFGAGEFVLMNGGQDVVYAGVGADLIDGGSATDVVSYIDSDAAVTVDLATQTGAGGFAEGDRYIAVEAFQGSNHDDQFYGSSEGDIFSGELGNDILLGADGDDTLNGGAGDDTLTGGAGNDAVDGGEGYDVAVLAIHYDQVEIEFSDGGFIITSDLGADFYINVDSFQFADVVKSADEITSQDLADISGSAGDDTLTGTNQSEVISAESGNDFLRGLGGDDMLFGMSGDDRLYGQAGDDTLVGGDGDDRLEGGAGADHIDGGSGRDIVQYVTATRSVRVDLQNPAISYNDAAGDTFVDVEVFQTGNTIDQLRGDAGANEFYTGGLSDRLYGRAGNDLLFGEDGADAFYGGLGADIMTGGSQAGRMDRFIYFDIRESGVGAGNRDIITDFVTGEDRIELSRFDADVTQGLKQRFVFVGNAELSGTVGELAYSYEGGNTIVQADTTGDGIANFEIELAGLLELSSGDFFI